MRIWVLSSCNEGTMCDSAGDEQVEEVLWAGSLFTSEDVARAEVENHRKAFARESGVPHVPLEWEKIEGLDKQGLITRAFKAYDDNLSEHWLLREQGVV